MNERRVEVKPENNSHRRHLFWALFLGILIFVLAFVGFYQYWQPNISISSRAAIIDPLSSVKFADSTRHRNDSFIEMAKDLLYSRFQEVDYYSDNATVESYTSLSSRGYRFIIWRAQTALNEEQKYVAISSAEKSTSANYQQYLENGQVTLWNITGDKNWYYAITPTFITNVMTGHFDKTIIVLMGCNGLRQNYYSLADSLIGKGAQAFISWDGWIDPFYNDNGISIMLNYLIEGNDTIGQAVSRVPSYSSAELGVSWLKWYPSEASSYNLPISGPEAGTSAKSIWALPNIEKYLCKRRFVKIDL